MHMAMSLWLLVFSISVATVSAGCPFDSVHSVPSTRVVVYTDKEICECKSGCGASYHDAYNREWCYTTDGCGKWGLSGSWDYCGYVGNANYTCIDAETRVESGSVILGVPIDKNVVKFILNSSYSPLPTSDVNLLDVARNSGQPSFDIFSDVLPDGRPKRLHMNGLVCVIQLDVSPASPFTGILKASNTVRGFARLSTGRGVDATSGIDPAVALKFPRSQEHSGDVLFSSFNIEKSYDFFKPNISNHIPLPKYNDTLEFKTLAAKLNTVSSCPAMLGLSDLCSFDQDGTRPKEIQFPYKLEVSSTLEIPSTPCNHTQLLSRMHKIIKRDVQLYTLTAYTSPTNSFEVGSIKVISPYSYQTVHMDTKLFFKHQRVEEDWKLNRTYYNFTKKGDPWVSCMSPSIEVSQWKGKNGYLNHDDKTTQTAPTAPIVSTVSTVASPWPQWLSISVFKYLCPTDLNENHMRSRICDWFAF